MAKRKSSNRNKRGRRQGPSRGNGRIIRAEQADELDLNDELRDLGYGRRDATEDEAADIDIAPPGARHTPADRTGRGGGTASRRGRSAEHQRRSAEHQRRSAEHNAARARADEPRTRSSSGHTASRTSTARGKKQRPRSRATGHGTATGAVGVLTCTAGPEEGLGLTLAEGVYGIGRGRDNHFVLKDIAASRQHIEIRVHNGQVTVYDLGSGNGTRVNGKRIQQVALKPGDRIEIGNSALTFTAMSRAIEEESEVSLVPPKPQPKPQDLWPETETLLSELQEFESRMSSRMGSRRREGPDELGPPPGPRGKKAQQTRDRPRPQQAPRPDLDPAASMAEIRASIGANTRFGSLGWLLLGALIIVVLIGGAATVFYLSYMRNSSVEQARLLATQGSLSMAQGELEEARRQVDEALKLDPKNAEAQKTLELLTRVEQSETAYKRANKMFEAGEFEDARHALEGVPKNTPRYDDVEALQQRIDEREAEELARQAQKLLKGKQIEDADKLSTRALRLDANNSTAAEVRAAVEKAKKTPLVPIEPKEAAPAPKPKPKPKIVKKPKKKKKKSTASRSLSDGEARDLYTDAVKAYKDDDLGRARRLMKQVLRGTSPGSKYHNKASSFISRRL